MFRRNVRSVLNWPGRIVSSLKVYNYFTWSPELFAVSKSKLTLLVYMIPKKIFSRFLTNVVVYLNFYGQREDKVSLQEVQVITNSQVIYIL